MSTWCAQAPGKVNLCLFLGATRADRRHELVTLFESVSLADELFVSVSDADRVICADVEGPNLVEQAIERLRVLGWPAPPLRVEITKRVPVAAGMGGGSADAAAMLRLARELAPLEDRVLAALAAELGADVPSQLAPGLAIGTGAGDVVQSRAPLAQHALVIVSSEHKLATAEVYREADRLGLPRPGPELARLHEELDAVLQPGARVPNRLLVNDLETAAVSLCPSIAETLDALRGSGADDVFVCGSGPTVAGLFWGDSGPALAAEAASSLQSSHPSAIVVEPADATFGIPRIA